jgi:hypothetical protein
MGWSGHQAKRNKRNAGRVSHHHPRNNSSLISL